MLVLVLFAPVGGEFSVLVLVLGLAGLPFISKTPVVVQC
jgi:hypothetical protein